MFHRRPISCCRIAHRCTPLDSLPASASQHTTNILWCILYTYKYKINSAYHSMLLSKYKRDEEKVESSQSAAAETVRMEIEFDDDWFFGCCCLGWNVSSIHRYKSIHCLWCFNVTRCAQYRGQHGVGHGVRQRARASVCLCVNNQRVVYATNFINILILCYPFWFVILLHCIGKWIRCSEMSCPTTKRNKRRGWKFFL